MWWTTPAWTFWFPRESATHDVMSAAIRILASLNGLIIVKPHSNATIMLEAHIGGQITLRN